jgi:hypothetical protein
LPLLFPCSEVPSFISEVPTVRATVSRDFRGRKFQDFSRRFRALKYNRYCSGFGVELAVVLFFHVVILGLLLEPNTNGGRQLLWRWPKLPCTNNEIKQNLKNQNQNTKQRIAKSSFLNSRFLKSRSLLQVSFVSFYREANGLFTFREHPRVKRIKTECARLFPGNIQLGLHVIGAS